MKLLFPLLPSPMPMVDDKINILVIENKKVFYEFVTGLYEQCYKNTGSIVLSKDEKELDIAKNLELILQLVPFESNRKTLVTKLQSHLNSVAVNEYYVSVCDIQSRIEKFLLELNDVSNCNITYDEPSILTILKAMNTRFNDDYESLCEALIEYFINVINLEGDKMFVILNLCDYITDGEYKEFKKTVIGHKIRILLLTCRHNVIAEDENVVIIDEDLCVI